MSTTIDWIAKARQAGKFFTPTTPINAQQLFAGREEQIRQIIDVINQQGQHAILYGERGVGKTSLANVISGFLNADKGRVLCPRINCDATDSFDSVWRKLIDRAQLTRTKEGVGFSRQSTATRLTSVDLLGDVAATPDSICRCLADIAQFFTPVFVVDEFDRLDVKARRTFADTIKALSDYGIQATLILVGVAESVEDLLAEHNSVQRALVQVRMPRMSNAELEAVVLKGCDGLGVTIESTAIERVVRLSQGLPHYAHLLSLHASRAALDSHSLIITVEFVKRALDRALDGTQQSILVAYETAIRSARKDNLFSSVLLSCALAETNELGEFAAQDIRGHLQKITGKEYQIPNFAQHLKEFCDTKRGPVLYKIGIPRLFRYKFIDPLLQPYVIMQGLKSKMINISDL